MLDLKGPGRVGARVAQVLHVSAPATPVLVCSRGWPGVDAFAGLPGARPVLSVRNRAELLRLRRRVRGPARPYGVSVHRSLLTPAVVADQSAAVDLVMTWGVDDHDVLLGVVDLGVNGVISDSAEVLRTVVHRR